MNGPEDTADSGLELDLGGDDAGGSDDASGSEMGFDLDKSVDIISKGLDLGDARARDVQSGRQKAPVEQVDAAATQAAVEAIAPPRSWSADKHELWKSLPRPAQEYYNQREEQMLAGIEQYKDGASFAKQMREIVSPYMPMLRAQGVTEHQAVQYLMNANYRLTQGTPEERMAAYREIGRDMGLLTGGEAGQTGEQHVTDPLVKQLQSELGQIKSVLSAEQRTRHEQARAKADTDVQAFAADKTNLYFDEVSKDMVGFINQGMDLKDAYEKAVWANPVTRAKEIARIKTEDAAKAPDPQKVEAARRATAVNSRGTETHRTPTEAKGKFLSDESMKNDLRAIKARH
jgi:hypothetical protein